MRYLLLFLILPALVLLFSSCSVVDTGYKGVGVSFSALNGKLYDEGLNWKMPIAESIVQLPVQVMKLETSAAGASSDLQNVQLSIAVNYRLRATSLPKIYQDMRKDWEGRVMLPIVTESSKAVSAQYTAEQLLTKRAEVSDKLDSTIKKRLDEYGIDVLQVNLLNIQYSASFNEAIEAKVTAEQQALAAKNQLEKVKYEAQQAYEAAKGKAEAIRVESEALKQSPAILEMRAIEKWNGVLPQVTGGATPFVNLAK